MTTTISDINNTSGAPVAYVGMDGATPTGWAAWAFAPQADQGFGWDVTTTKAQQALLIYAGEFLVWDDSNWNIWFEQVGTGYVFSLHVNAVPFGSPAIQITVMPNGMISAVQSNGAAEQLAKVG
jgi:hypothetical protein